MEMTNCPNEMEFRSLVASSAQTNDEKKKIQMYKQNKRLCAIITLGQDSDHGLAAIQRIVAKGTDPHGSAYKFMNILEEKH
jgi:3'-phosphoadenosine 5'-phosphosulfate (PAPS) 3'-phosphatase